MTLRTMYVTGAALSLMLAGALLPLACMSNFCVMHCKWTASAQTQGAHVHRGMYHYSMAKALACRSVPGGLRLEQCCLTFEEFGDMQGPLA